MRRVIAAAVVTTLVLAPAGAAKFRMTLAVSDTTPKVGAWTMVTLRADLRPGAKVELRLIRVPPGYDIYKAIKQEARYGVALVREGSSWRGAITFSRPGSWRLVVPSWGGVGYAVPPPLVREIHVS